MELLNYISKMCEPSKVRRINYKTRDVGAKNKLLIIKKYLESEDLFISLDIRQESEEYGIFLIGNYRTRVHNPFEYTEGTLEFSCSDSTYEYILKKFPELRTWREEYNLFRCDSDLTYNSYFDDKYSIQYNYDDEFSTMNNFWISNNGDVNFRIN